MHEKYSGFGFPTSPLALSMCRNSMICFSLGIKVDGLKHNIVAFSWENENALLVSHLPQRSRKAQMLVGFNQGLIRVSNGEIYLESRHDFA